MTAALWLPGARRDPRDWTRYTMNGAGGSRRVVLHTTESTQDATCDGIADYMWRTAGPGTGYTLLYHPSSGDMLQLRPADAGAGSLRNLSGGVETNRNGTVSVQVSVVAYAGEDWTRYGCPRWPELLAWLRSWGIPDTWVAAPFVDGRATMSTAHWTGPASGWCGHQHVPENDHSDPGPRPAPWTIGTAQTGDPDMILVQRPDGATYLVGTGQSVGVHSPADLEALQAALRDPGHVAKISQEQWRNIAELGVADAP